MLRLVPKSGEPSCTPWENSRLLPLVPAGTEERQLAPVFSLR